MVEPLSLQLALAQQLGSVFHTIAAQNDLVPSAVPHRLRWGRNPEAISYIWDFNPDLPFLHRRSLASITLTAWDNRYGRPSVSWPQVIGSHCRSEILPSGQILFTPTPLALGAWLWQLVTTEKEFQTYPQVGLPVSPSPPDPVLAERLQLSLKAVVPYTHGRCRQLLAIAAATASSQIPSPCPAFPWIDQPYLQPADQGSRLAPNPELKASGEGSRAMNLCHCLYPVGYGEAVLRGLVKLVDCLTLAPLTQEDPSESPLFNAAYGLSVAVDRWIGHGTLDRAALSTIVLLRGIDRTLAAALSAEAGRASAHR